MEPDLAVGQALDVLAARLVLHEAHTHDSHHALVITGLEDQAVINALGLYLMGLLAGIVQTNLRLSSALLDSTPEGQEQLEADVEARLSPVPGSTPEQADLFRMNVRDPWIAEGIGHATFAIRSRVETVCLPGPVAAMMVPHTIPSQQGLDLFAIFDEGGLPVLALGEAKATQNNGSGRLTESIAFFRTVDAGDRDLDIRLQVVLLTESLDESLQQGLSGSFWHQRAAYLPFIAHGDDVDMSQPRPGFRAIARPAAQKRVIHCRPANYPQFFDSVADAMRDALGTINT
jgi:hypothetical protein